MRRSFKTWGGLGLMCFLATGASSSRPSELDTGSWGEMVQTRGHAEPVPRKWLGSEEARFAHDLVLPPTKAPVPFDFRAAWRRSWLPGQLNVAKQYFFHLCHTEAGEWIFKRYRGVVGIYFARHVPQLSTDVLTDPYGPEMPWFEAYMSSFPDRAREQAYWFFERPHFHYGYVEMPRRSEAPWQAKISTRYVRLSGETNEPVMDKDGHPTGYYRPVEPQVTGVDKISAPYGYTWRGISRPRDREHGIAGGEVIIYNVQTNEILAVRRSFVIAFKNPRGKGKAMWEIAATCSPQFDRRQFQRFAFRTIEPVELADMYRE